MRHECNEDEIKHALPLARDEYKKINGIQEIEFGQLKLENFF